MWDAKRQVIWLAAGIIFGTVFLYPLAYDDDGRFDLAYFLQLETLLLLVVAIMFYVYSRKK